MAAGCIRQSAVNWVGVKLQVHALRDKPDMLLLSASASLKVPMRLSRKSLNVLQ